jgi:DNA-directed RNA polymerase subunit L
MTNINIKQKSWTSNVNSRLEFTISGVNNTIVNCMRRIALSSIPIYVFKDIQISENTSIFNNNYMKLRLNNLPVLGIATDNPIYKKKEIIIKEDNEMDDIDMSTNEDVNSSSLKQLTMYLDKINTTDEIITIGTDDCKFYFMEKQIDSPYKLPYCNNIPLIKLQPKQKIKLSAITSLGIENENSIYSAVSIFCYQMIDTGYNVIVESRGQLDEKTILNYTCINIINILDQFILKLNLQDIPVGKIGKILIGDSDHTLGTLISTGLQGHKKIKFAGYNMPHLLDNTISFDYEIYKEDNIKEILGEIVDELKETYTTIMNLILKNITPLHI